MTSILAVDTATAACSVALSKGEEIFHRSDFTPRSHTKSLLPMVHAVLADGNTDLGEIDAIAFSHGPGSFTGIRIGFGAVQGLALGAEKPVIPVSTLELLTLTSIRTLAVSEEAYFLTALDARMDQIYWSAFKLSCGRMSVICPDTLSAPEAAFQEIDLDPRKKLFAVGNGWLYASRIGLSPQKMEVELLPEALDMLPLARQHYLEGGGVAIENVQPVYLRDSVTWKKRERLRP